MSMKIYINSSIQLNTGAYLLDRDGELIPVDYHVPSSTYYDRGIKHLCCTDAQFLYDEGMIDEDDADIIAKYCLKEFLQDIKNLSSFSMMDVIEFDKYGELKYAPLVRGSIMKLRGDVDNILTPSELSKFNTLNNKWYKFLCNNYVKVSVLNKYIEFRISSQDNFNWNTVIIDDCIMNLDNNSKYLYTILRESNKGFKSYFVNATLNEILETDKIVLSSKYTNTRVSLHTIR